MRVNGNRGETTQSEREWGRNDSGGEQDSGIISYDQICKKKVEIFTDSLSGANR
jgi:hypothetical protein